MNTINFLTKYFTCVTTFKFTKFYCWLNYFVIENVTMNIIEDLLGLNLTFNSLTSL